jgi:Protein of unknown function (DUF402)
MGKIRRKNFHLLSSWASAQASRLRQVKPDEKWHIMRWYRGAQIAIREHWNRKVWTVRPVTVVADTPEVIALYMMPGTIYKHPRAIDGSPVPHFLPDDWVLVTQQWCGGGALYLSLPGHWYVLMGLFGDDNQRIERWYVNLQTPYQRTRIGFDYLDQELDIVINRELSNWSWKDEAQFLDAQRRGRIPVEQAAYVRRVGEDILEQLQAGRLTLPEPWRHWRPPEQWAIPPIPHDWHVLE